MKKVVQMSHGAGGKSFDDLMIKTILPALDNPCLRPLTDGARLSSLPGQLVMATDSHVVHPRIFPGGSLGKLSFCGTVNDLAMMGADPVYLSVAMIIEEGFSEEELSFHLQELGRLSRHWQIPVVTGDTKVVERGKGDGLFITTTGIGLIRDHFVSSDPSRIQTGDVIIVSGCLGNHGVCLLSQRENLSFASSIASDCAPVHKLTLKLWKKFPAIRCMRDPTRGGLAAVLNEFSRDTNLVFELVESNIPFDKGVLSVCELLGLDPLQLASEGRFLLVAQPEYADSVLSLMRQHELGSDSAVIGTVGTEGTSCVKMKTMLGGSRLIPWPDGEQLPRIC